MKHTLFLVLAAVLTLGIASCSSKTTSTDAKALPVEVQKVVKANFTSPVASTKIEKNTFGADEYTVYLADGTKIKFENNEWEDIEVARGSQVPDYFVIQPIREYISANQSGAKVVSVDKDKKGYEVKLSNGVEIEFDTAGKFIKYDH